MAGVGALILVSSTGGLASSASESETRAFSGDTIVFHAGANEIEVLGGAATGKVEVTRRSHWGVGGAKPAPNETWGEGVLEIGGPDCNGLSWRCSIDYVVRVPDGTAVTVDSGSGDIAVRGALGALDLNAGSGDIDGQGLATDRVVVRTGSGDIDLGFASGSPDVVAKAGSGSIDLDLRTAPRALDVRTGSGDVDINVPEAQAFRWTSTPVPGIRTSTSRRPRTPTGPSSCGRDRVTSSSGRAILGP